MKVTVFHMKGYILIFFKIFSGQNYKVHKEMKKFVTQVTLNILDVDQRDFGTYECVAKNPLGESDGTINLSGMISEIIAVFYINQGY